jgi:hypothetical protein
VSFLAFPVTPGPWVFDKVTPSATEGGKTKPTQSEGIFSEGFSFVFYLNPNIADVVLWQETFLTVAARQRPYLKLELWTCGVVFVDADDFADELTHGCR